MEETLLNGEIMKRAKMLFESKGRGALEYANHTYESMKKTGYEEDRVYWHRIIVQVELLIEEAEHG